MTLLIATTVGPTHWCEPAGSRPPLLAAGSRTQWRSLGKREHPDDAALRHVRLPSDQLAHEPLLEGRVDAVAGRHRDILHAIDHERRRRRHDAGVGAELPKLLARPRIVGTELA